MFTETQSKILALLVNQPDKEYYMSEIGRVLNKKPGVFQKGLNSLEKQNIITSRKIGGTKFVKINKEYPLFSEIKSIIQKTSGTEGLLRNILKIKGVLKAYIYGSYAKDRLRPDSDIDLIVVVTTPKIDDLLVEAISKAEQYVQREINYKLYSKKEFREKLESNNPFLEEVFSDKYITLIP
jgi:predicted nucleotidyltransferase